MENTTLTAVHKKKRRISRSRVRESLELYVLMLIPLSLLFFMCYMPMPGLAIAFQDYQLGDSFISSTSHWVGFKHFENFINGRLFGRLMGNTLRISIKSLLITFPIPIAFALLLNEIKHMKTKKIVQTISYLPHFISTIIVAGMVRGFLDRNTGLINQIVELFGGKRQNFIAQKSAFDTIYICVTVWISFGFESILYMSAISGVDQELYEAARLDGATRWQQCWHITLPGILPTVSICLIMALGGILGANTDLIMNLYHSGTAKVSEIIGTYVYRMGLGIDNAGVLPQYSATGAISIFSSVINITMLFIANKISNWLTGTGLW